MGTYISQEGEVGIPQSHLYPSLSLQGLPGLPGGVGQPGAVGEKVREGGQGTAQGGGGTTSPGCGGLCWGASVCLPEWDLFVLSLCLLQGEPGETGDTGPPGTPGIPVSDCVLCPCTHPREPLVPGYLRPP